MPWAAPVNTHAHCACHAVLRREKHFPRSALIPLGKYENKGYYMVGDEAQPSYNDPNRQEWLRRKGMGDVTLLKETDTSDSSRRADTNNMFVGGRMRVRCIGSSRSGSNNTSELRAKLIAAAAAEPRRFEC